MKMSLAIRRKIMVMEFFRQARTIVSGGCCCVITLIPLMERRGEEAGPEASLQQNVKCGGMLK